MLKQQSTWTGALAREMAASFRFAWLSGLLLCWAGVGYADQNNADLPGWFDKLRNATSPSEAAPVEREIWSAWIDIADAGSRGLLAEGMRAMSAGNLDQAIEHFSVLIEAQPTFAEAWNKRATALFYSGKHDDSVRDIQATLALEPRHFGALSGLGLVFLEREDFRGALLAFEQVLTIHPQSMFARVQAERLRKHLEKNPV
ncbi:MAG: tetratricopeptide repeat protein [Chromatiales bacterium]|nr:tetratricopeptide repeat protein [Chromatiales bacterium]